MDFTEICCQACRQMSKITFTYKTPINSKNKIAENLGDTTASKLKYHSNNYYTKFHRLGACACFICQISSFIQQFNTAYQIKITTISYFRDICTPNM